MPLYKILDQFPLHYSKTLPFPSFVLMLPCLFTFDLFRFSQQKQQSLVCLCPTFLNVLYCKILTLNDLDMVINPRNTYKGLGVSYIIYLVFLLHVSATLRSSSGRCSTKNIFKNFSNQCTPLRMATSVAQ